MSVMGILHGLRRIGDPIERHQTGVSWLAAGWQLIGESMRRGVLQLQTAVLRHLAIPGLALLISLGSAFAQSGDTRAQEQGAKPAAGNSQAPADATKDNQRRTDEFVEA